MSIELIKNKRFKKGLFENSKNDLYYNNNNDKPEFFGMI